MPETLNQCFNKTCIANSCDGGFCQLECLAENAPNIIREFNAREKNVCVKLREKAGILCEKSL